MDATNLKVWLPFDTSATEDKLGNEWTASGSPTIQDGKLILNGSSYLKMTEAFAFTGQPFTIGCKFSGTSNTTGGAVCLWQMYIGDSNRFHISIDANGRLALWKDTDSTVHIRTNSSVLDGQEHHVECDLDGSTWYLFLDGNLVGTKAHTCTARNYTLYLGANYSTGRKFTGTIDEFQIFDGVALHTENFSPPTADDYIALALELDGQANVTFSFDVERKLANVVEVTFDVQRKVNQKWRYINVGTADLLSISGTTLSNLPESKSKTGTAFYQTTRAKCFDIPATDEIWLKFDVYFNGSNRWRAYNGGANDTTGATAQTDGAFNVWINGANNGATSNICVANKLQTVLLHMVSGSSSGIVEAWVDGEKVYSYTGDVNHGEDFADIYLQSDGAGTFFSNVIISNSEITFDEGYHSISFDVQRKLSKPIEFFCDIQRIFIQPIIVPAIEEHFNHFVETVTLFHGGAQKIILPKKSSVYIRGYGAGAIKFSSDIDNNTFVAFGDFLTANEFYAKLDECETVFIEFSEARATSQTVIKTLMHYLKNNNGARLNSAIEYVTDGDFYSKNSVANQFMEDLERSESYTDFLRDYCDIILDNDDTGAISGADAGGGSIKTAESIVPEKIPISQWVMPTAGSSSVINGFSSGAGGIFSNAEKFILKGLNSEWIKRSLDLIEESLGLNFETDASPKEITVGFTNSSSSALAFTEYYQKTWIRLLINMAYFASIDTASEDGALFRSHPEYYEVGYLDRTIAHELTHAVMIANIPEFGYLPAFIREGSAELVHGIDDGRKDAIVELLTTQKEELLDLMQGLISSTPSYEYAAGYLFLRYFAKQGQNRVGSYIPNEIEITNLLISDGATLYNGGTYEALTDNTRQIISADFSRQVIKSFERDFDVEILQVIIVELFADIKRALIAEVNLFARDSEDFFNDPDNPFVVRDSNSLLRKARRLRAANLPSNTQGLQNFEVTIAEQQITDQLRFSTVIPFDIMQQVTGQYLDYHYNMRVERVQQQGIIYSCDCCSDVDQLLFTQLAYKIPATTTWTKIDGEEVGGTPKTVEFQTVYPPASAHVNLIASALHLTPVMQFDNFLSTVLMDEQGGVTYNDLIRDIFGWSSRVPNMLINVFIRDGKLFVIQRGHESHTIDISNAQMTVPIITKEIVRTTWGSTPWSKTTTWESELHYHVPPDVVINPSQPSQQGEEENWVTIQDHSSGLNWDATTTYYYARGSKELSSDSTVNKRAGLLLEVTVNRRFSSGDITNESTHIIHDYDEDGTRIGTTTSVIYHGLNPPPDTVTVNKLGYITLPNGEKYLAREATYRYEDNELVDVNITTHSPSRLGQTHVITLTNDGVAGEVTGQNTGDDRVTPFRNKQAYDLETAFENSTFNSATGEWKTKKQETGMTVHGLSLYDSSFPIHDEATLIKVTNALRNLNRKTKETVNLSLYDFEHLIDFDDKIILNGKTYFLANNTARTTPRIKFEQNLSLVRWY